MIVTPHNQLKLQYSAFVDSVAFAGGKNHFVLFNGSTDKLIKLCRVYPINQQLDAVAGVGVRMNINRVSTSSGGTLVAIGAYDSLDLPKLDAGVTCRTGGSATFVALATSFSMNNDEVPLTNATIAYQKSNVLTADGDYLKYGIIRQGEGFALNQVTATTIGLYGWAIAFTQENVNPVS